MATIVALDAVDAPQKDRPLNSCTALMENGCIIFKCLNRSSYVILSPIQISFNYFMSINCWSIPMGFLDELVSLTKRVLTSVNWTHQWCPLLTTINEITLSRQHCITIRLFPNKKQKQKQNYVKPMWKLLSYQPAN